MSLEAAIAANTAAIEALTEALKAGGVPAAAEPSAKASTPAADKPKGRGKKAAAEAEAPKTKRTKAEMQAALNEVKEALGTAEAKKLIADAGFERLAEVTEDKYDELYEAAKARLTAEEGGDEDDGL